MGEHAARRAAVAGLAGPERDLLARGADAAARGAEEALHREVLEVARRERGRGLEVLRREDLCTGEVDWAQRLRAEVLAELELPGGVRLGGEELEEAVYLAAVFRQNAFAFAAEDGGRREVIFPTICRANHSCAPNAVLVPCAESNEESMLVACRPVAAGEPVEISYLPARYLLRGAPQRRDALREKWGFACACPRCAADLDLMRRFAVRCEACGAAEAAAAGLGRGAGLRCVSCAAEVPGSAPLAEEAM